jgi:L-histidine N-alpha-methyltransferase
MNCQTLDVEGLALLESREALIYECQRGLGRRPRSLPPWIFYDARGSRLFERITKVPEYYLTRTERSILTRFADFIVAFAGADQGKRVRVLELGAGTASKTVVLLEAMARVQTEMHYVPIDVSPDALDIACGEIASRLPEVCVEPIIANYVTDSPQLKHFDGTTLAIYIGSSIGNFSPIDARTILRNLGSQLQSGDALLLGTDLVKDESTLVAAYDDKQGVTAAFNLNILHRLNRELGSDFNLGGFMHRAVWNAAKSRIEMHLESRCDQHVEIAAADLQLEFAKGETIHTENSYKFTSQTIRMLLEDSGFEMDAAWTDPHGWYAITLGLFS